MTDEIKAGDTVVIKTGVFVGTEGTVTEVLKRSPDMNKYRVSIPSRGDGFCFYPWEIER